MVVGKPASSYDEGMTAASLYKIQYLSTTFQWGVTQKGQLQFTFYGQIHKHCCKESSASMCEYKYEFACYFTTKCENTTLKQEFVSSCVNVI